MGYNKQQQQKNPFDDVVRRSFGKSALGVVTAAGLQRSFSVRAPH